MTSTSSKREITLPVTQSDVTDKTKGSIFYVGNATLLILSFVKGNARLKITATPGRHGPLPISMFMPQVMGSILDFCDTLDDHNRPRHLVFRIYITGDTMVFDDIKDIPKHYPDVDVAMFILVARPYLEL
jgi:hypothetical protein